MRFQGACLCWNWVVFEVGNEFNMKIEECMFSPILFSIKIELWKGIWKHAWSLLEISCFSFEFFGFQAKNKLKSSTLKSRFLETRTFVLNRGMSVTIEGLGPFSNSTLIVVAAKPQSPILYLTDGMSLYLSTRASEHGHRTDFDRV